MNVVRATVVESRQRTRSALLHRPPPRPVDDARGPAPPALAPARRAGHRARCAARGLPAATRTGSSSAACARPSWSIGACGSTFDLDAPAVHRYRRRGRRSRPSTGRRSSIVGRPGRRGQPLGTVPREPRPRPCPPVRPRQSGRRARRDRATARLRIVGDGDGGGVAVGARVVRCAPSSRARSPTRRACRARRGRSGRP